MARILILGTTALMLSAGAASAQGAYVAPDYGYAPGYGGYGYTAPGPFSDYAPQPQMYGYAAPGYGYDYTPPAAWARGYWGRRNYGWQ
jgi:hypothetical protein